MCVPSRGEAPTTERKRQKEREREREREREKQSAICVSNGP